MSDQVTLIILCAFMSLGPLLILVSVIKKFSLSRAIDKAIDTKDPTLLFRYCDKHKQARLAILINNGSEDTLKREIKTLLKEA